ncbi:hypothetical protein SmJEL517_g00261 [Synchytrium microbalum]|uniref:NADH:ubiquinone oxidoreductase intermediate-associated protein 30 domain-containing protein n=1 Tax=Synchytrium microbalum TaxID=1806994 RepID=A0A507C994_9FUNG|nr:uncharacterized protein SmJEL517_g00261 [Synchytrium microbalum]TPX38160.1 hypothetical protein SmJEL517_g00261 [Synchytrium microbalum]
MQYYRGAIGVACLVGGMVQATSTSGHGSSMRGAAARIASERTESDLSLYGGDNMWNAADWETVDDRVRGGKSESHLTVLEDGGAAIFHGFLDIETLGGAGFASQRTTPLPAGKSFDLSKYDGLGIRILRGDGKKYALNIKNNELTKRPDGRVESSIEYKAVFTTTDGSDGMYYFPFSTFQAYYRGKISNDAPPLENKSITSFSIMMQSYFGEQKGEFELVIASISAMTDKWVMENSESGVIVEQNKL